MADYRYNVMHDVNGNEQEQIRKLLSQLKQHDTCTIIVDHVGGTNADRVLGAINGEQFEVYTRGVNEDDTQFVVRRKH